MSLYTETHLPKSSKDWEQYHSESVNDLIKLQNELELKRIKRQLENQNENKSSKRESL